MRSHGRARTSPRHRPRPAPQSADVVSFTLEDRPAVGGSSKTPTQPKIRVLTVILATPDAAAMDHVAAKK